MLIFSKYQHLFSLISSIMFLLSMLLKFYNFYCFFPFDCSNLQFFLFLLLPKVHKYIDLRSFFFTNICIQCYNFMGKHCFTCILQLLMLCFHLVQIIIIFYYWSIVVYNVVFISGTLVKIIFNFSWDITWYLFHLLNWLKYWSNVFNFKIYGSILFIFLLSSSHLILIYSEDFVWFIFSKIC